MFSSGNTGMFWFATLAIALIVALWFICRSNISVLQDCEEGFVIFGVFTLIDGIGLIAIFFTIMAPILLSIIVVVAAVAAVMYAVMSNE